MFTFGLLKLIYCNVLTFTTQDFQCVPNDLQWKQCEDKTERCS